MVVDLNTVNASQLSGGRNNRVANEPAGERTSDAPAKTAPSGTPSDSVQLSAKANSLQQLEGRIRDMDSVDMEKVESLKQRIASGEYQVNADNIANKLIQEDII